jgi:DNA repair protein RecO (recombination protein O)
MITDAIKAWVIHKSWSGDTSARVVFFTREYGLIACFYKGGRSPKKQALLQAFTPLWLTMDIRGHSYFVRQLEMAEFPLQLLGQNLFSGLYVNELLYHMLRPHDQHSLLYDAYIETLQTLMIANGRLTLEPLLRRFEWTVLTTCGYHMSLTHEADSTSPIVVDKYYRFVAGEGFYVDEEGIAGGDIIALAHDKLDDLTVLNTAKKIMRRAIDFVLDGKEIKARALYRS